MQARNVTLSLGSGEAKVAILKGVDLTVSKGETVALLGPSGSGKSSLMAVLAGLERASGGEIIIDGVDFGQSDEDALARARRSVDQWTKADVDAVIVTASGCGTTIKDYGHMLRLDPAYAEKAKAISAKAKDVTEFLVAQNLPEAKGGLRLAYHSACSMQHGQKIRTEPQKLLRRAGFTVMEVPEGHLCCGSAGTYSVLNPELSKQLRDRKLGHLTALEPQGVISANIGCITHLQSVSGLPVRHWVELLDGALASAF